DAIPFRFGLNSADAHETTARAQGRRVERVLLPYLSRDIDRPEDLTGAFAPAQIAAGAKVFAIPGIGEIEAGDDLAAAIADAAQVSGQPPAPGDIVVVA